MIKQGEIYLVNFGKKYNSEIGKIRPAVILQNNFLNRTVESKLYRQVLVIPLSTVQIEDDFRMKIIARDRLEKDSFIISNWVCTLDFENILVEKGGLTKLNSSELEDLKKRFCSLI